MTQTEHSTDAEAVQHGASRVVVNDGSFLHVASTDELLRALRRLGWTDTPRGTSALWIEPASDPETGGAYADLCDAVEAEIVGDSADTAATCVAIQEAGAATFTYHPDLGGWLLEFARTC